MISFKGGLKQSYYKVNITLPSKGELVLYFVTTWGVEWEVCLNTVGVTPSIKTTKEIVKATLDCINLIKRRHPLSKIVCYPLSRSRERLYKRFGFKSLSTSRDGKPKMILS